MKLSTLFLGSLHNYQTCANLLLSFVRHSNSFNKLLGSFEGFRILYYLFARATGPLLWDTMKVI